MDANSEFMDKARSQCKALASTADEYENQVDHPGTKAILMQIKSLTTACLHQMSQMNKSIEASIFDVLNKY